MIEPVVAVRAASVPPTPRARRARKGRLVALGLLCVAVFACSSLLPGAAAEAVDAVKPASAQTSESDGVNGDDRTLHFQSSAFLTPVEKNEVLMRLTARRMRAEQVRQRLSQATRDAQQADAARRAAASEEESLLQEATKAEQRVVREAKMTESLREELERASEAEAPDIASEVEEQAQKEAEARVEAARARQTAQEATLARGRATRLAEQAQRVLRAVREQVEASSAEHEALHDQLRAAEEAEAVRRQRTPYPPFHPHPPDVLERIAHAAFHAVADETSNSMEESVKAGGQAPRMLQQQVDAETGLPVYLHRSKHNEGTLRARHVLRYVLRALNPDGQAITEDERRIVEEEVRRFRAQEGLASEDSPTVLYAGYLCRGRPLRFLRDLSHKLYQRRMRAQKDEL